MKHKSTKVYCKFTVNDSAVAYVFIPDLVTTILPSLSADVRAERNDSIIIRGDLICLSSPLATATPWLHPLPSTWPCPTCATEESKIEKDKTTGRKKGFSEREQAYKSVNRKHYNRRFCLY